MKSLSKAVAIASLLSAGVMTAQVANAEVSFNAAVVSDYVFRGLSFSDNGFALQGGADYSDKSGVYAGVWASTVDGGDDSIEYDLYAGYTTEMNGLELTAGYIAYNGDDAGLANAEIHANVVKDNLSAGLYIDIENDNNMYLEGGYSQELSQEVGLDLRAGYAMPDEGDDTLDLSASLGKEFEGIDFGATITYIDADVKDDVLFFLSASKEF